MLMGEHKPDVELAGLLQKHLDIVVEIFGCLVDEEEGRMAMDMLRDRNLTVHTYNEELADQIYSRLPSYAVLMERWVEAMSGQRTFDLD